jgi:hypothetical protein
MRKDTNATRHAPRKRVLRTLNMVETIDEAVEAPSLHIVVVIGAV